jgi:hypothetical protein
MIKQRKAVGRLYIGRQSFLILSTSEPKIWNSKLIIGTEDKVLKDVDFGYYYQASGRLQINGTFVYKEFTQPQDILIYVKESDNEESK